MKNKGGIQRKQIQLWLYLLGILLVSLNILQKSQVAIEKSPRTDDSVLRQHFTAQNETNLSTLPKNKTTPHILNCTEMKDAEILSELGRGKRRIMYKVKLPNGQLAVAKRCFRRSDFCFPGMKKESELMAMLQEAYGDQAVAVYGICQNEPSTPYIDRIYDKLGDGPTLLVELGTPLKQEGWNGNIQYNFNEADLRDLDTIAQQYANLPGRPLMMGVPFARQRTDNYFPQQYARFRSGIRHIDLEDTFYPNEPDNQYATMLNEQNKTQDLTPSVALEVNRCIMLQYMAGVTEWDGTSEHYCKRDYKILPKKRRKKPSS